MRHIIFSALLLFSITGCGGDSDTTTNTIIAPATIETTEIDSTVTSRVALEVVENNSSETPVPELNTTIEPPKVEKVVTIFIHGYDKTGYKKEALYGNDEALEKHADVVDLVGFSTLNDAGQSELKNNLLLATNYYGNEAPDYYTEQDIKDIEEITALHGGGIPRYSLIVAKYAKHVMTEHNVTKVNFLSASMGSLVTRWLIENNIEDLASDKKIAKWLSFEGVVRGNYPASSSTLIDLAEFFEKQSPDVEHMSYNWIDKQFSSRAIGDSVYYKDILLGFETSTDDNLIEKLLSRYLVLNGGYKPNDGYQLARDTYFEINDTKKLFNDLPPTHTYFHQNHLNLSDHKPAWAQAITFLTSKKRVRITLTKATVNDIHEERKEIKIFGRVVASHNFKPAEIVFESSVVSPKVDELWGISNPIDFRSLESGALTIYKYKNHGDTNTLNQELFNDFVNQEETTLTLHLNAHEIDLDIRYNKEELTGHKTENLGAGSIDIPIENGTHQISGADWDGEVKVEVFEY